jgi:hypothetical protein
MFAVRRVKIALASSDDETNGGRLKAHVSAEFDKWRCIFDILPFFEFSRYRMPVFGIYALVANSVRR